jgi:hypothetical protein
MKPILITIASLFIGCCFSAMSLFYARDEGQANSDLDNSWVVQKGSSPDILFSHPLPPPNASPFDPRMNSWRRHSYGLPVQWLVKDHSPDNSFYYARVDIGYAVFSAFTFSVATFLFIAALPRSLRDRAVRAICLSASWFKRYAFQRDFKW